MGAASERCREDRAQTDTSTFTNGVVEEPLKEIAKEQPARGEKTRKVQCTRSQGKKIISKRMDQVTLMNGADKEKKNKNKYQWISVS